MASTSTPLAEPRYSGSYGSRVLRVLVNVLGKIRVNVHPFFVVREGGHTSTMAPDARFASGFIGIDDIPELVRIEPGVDAAKCAERLRRGLLCYAVKDGSRIVAKMWCDLNEFSFQPNYRELESGEAYLFGAYTDPTYRGQNLAPLMRLSCYAALRAIGRDTFFSYTDYSNAAARSFKRKLGAVDESLRVHVTVFGRFSQTFTLRTYASGNV